MKLLLPALILASCVSLLADTFVWDGGGDGTSWTSTNNWDLDSGYPASAADFVVIRSGGASITVPAGVTLGGLVIDTGYSGTVSLASNLTLSGAGGHDGNLTVNAGTLRTGLDTVSGISVAGQFNIGTNGTVVVRRSSTAGNGAGQSISAATMRVDGTLHANGQGFAGKQGPGGAANDATGGTHGGVGGDNTKATYGSVANPTSLGSGGGGSVSGGGAIAVSVSGKLTVEGTISANGASAAIYGAGAGGSLSISAGELAGRGAIRVNGAAADRAGGGGGRVSLANVGTFSFSGAIEANGGTGVGTTYARGHAGTIVFPAGHALTLGGDGNMRTLRLGSDDQYGYAFGSILIETNGVLEIDGNPNVNSGQGSAATIAADTVEIKNNGKISADGLGFSAGRGPGKVDGNASATHGGVGGDNDKPTYGSAANPVALGSANSAGGGGAIIPDVAVI